MSGKTLARMWLTVVFGGMFSLLAYHDGVYTAMVEIGGAMLLCLAVMVTIVAAVYASE